MSKIYKSSMLILIIMTLTVLLGTGQTGEWQNFNLSTSSTDLVIYESEDGSLHALTINVEVFSSDGFTSITLDGEGPSFAYETLREDGGTVEMVAKKVTMSVIGDVSGRYMVEDHGNAIDHQAETIPDTVYFGVFVGMPIVIMLLTLLIIRTSWRRA